MKRYDIPAVNAYDPDIVLEDELDGNGVVAFYLPVNYYKQLARYIGLCVFQHVQQVGALRQLDRSRAQAPVFVYADEFYSFAYEGFTDAVNKLRDRVTMLLHLPRMDGEDSPRSSTTASPPPIQFQQSEGTSPANIHPRP